MKYELLDLGLEHAAIKVIGIGDAGDLAIKNMRNSTVENVEFHSFAEANIKPILGRCHLLFLIADMSESGKTADFFSVAEKAKELEILTISVVTIPSVFDYIAELTKVSDSLILIQNKPDNIINDMQLDIVRCMSDAVTQQSIIGFDFADLKMITKDAGLCAIGIGTAEGENREDRAAQDAVSSLLSSNVSIFQQAYGVLVNISAANMGISEFDTVGNIVHDLALDDVVIKITTTLNQSLGDKIKVTIVVTGVHGII